MLRDGVMIMIALMCGGCFGVVVTCCMVTAKRSDQSKQVILVAAFNLMGDALRDVLDPKEVQK